MHASLVPRHHGCDSSSIRRRSCRVVTKGQKRSGTSAATKPWKRWPAAVRPMTRMKTKMGIARRPTTAIACGTAPTIPTTMTTKTPTATTSKKIPPTKKRKKKTCSAAADHAAGQAVLPKIRAHPARVRKHQKRRQSRFQWPLMTMTTTSLTTTKISTTPMTAKRIWTTSTSTATEISTATTTSATHHRPRNQPQSQRQKLRPSQRLEQLLPQLS